MNASYRAMRKGAAVVNPVWHAVEAGLERTVNQSACGQRPKTIWVDGGDTDLVTCSRCRRILFASPAPTPQG